MTSFVYSLIASPNDSGGTNLFVGNYNGIFLSTNNGTNWTEILNSTGELITSIAFSKTGSGEIYLFSGWENAGVWLSTNNGTSWTPLNFGAASSSVFSLVIGPTGSGGTNIFAGTYEVTGGRTEGGGDKGGGVFLITNHGTDWTAEAENSGLGSAFINTLLIKDTYLFAGTNSYGVWRRPLSEMITGIEDKPKSVISNFVLGQNYPNPFNPSTTIKYAIPNPEHVILKVYNVLGKEIATLVNGNKSAGEYIVTFNAPNLASGIYFYRITAGGFTDTKKLILLK